YCDVLVYDLILSHPTRPEPSSPLFPYTTLFRSRRTQEYIAAGDVYQLELASRFSGRHELDPFQAYRALRLINPSPYMYYCALGRSEEHTSELQSLRHPVCRLLLEKKNSQLIQCQ